MNLANFDPAFLDAVLKLMLTDLKFMRDYSVQLSPSLFPDNIRFQVASYALEFYKGSRCVARNLIQNYILEHARRDRLPKDNVTLLVDASKVLLDAPQPAISYVTERLDYFFRYSQLNKTRELLEQALIDGDISAAEKAVTAAIRQAGESKERPIDYFATIQQRVNRRDILATQDDGVRFFVPTLDKKGVYAHRGEVSLIIAPSKRGKSICLTHVGKCAVIAGHHVLHVSLENPLSMVEDRYDAMWTGIPVSELRMMADRFQVHMSDVLDMVKGRLHILWRMADTYTPLDLKLDVEQLRSEGVRIDTVIIDYAELLKPVVVVTGSAKPRVERSNIFMYLRGIATVLDFICITAHQTPLAKKKYFRLGMEDAQESSGPSQHSSLIMTLNQTPDELEHNEMRIFVDGYWHGPSAALGDILIEQNFDRMQFCVREMELLDGVEARKRVVAIT